MITRISSIISMYSVMIDQVNELPEDGLKPSPETSRYRKKYMDLLKN